MLKKIPTDAVRLGMYLHAIEGSWLAHPFWKNKFIIDDPEDLQRLRQSGLTGVWINISKGVDVADQAVVLSTPASIPPPEDPRAPAVARCSARDELQRAARVLSRSKKAITELFNEARLGNAISVESCLPLVADISDSLARNSSALIGLARLKHKDEYTYLHSVAVCA